MSGRACRCSTACVAALLIATVVSAGAYTEEPFGWRVGPTAWSFRLFSFFEAIDKTASLGMSYIEAFEGQSVLPGEDAKLGPDMAEDLYPRIQEKLKAAGVQLVSVYIHNIPGEETACRRIFAFAQKLGVGIIVSEPAPEALDTIESCAEAYKINVALHNHPEGSSRYWHPDEIMRVCEGRGPRIGACGDTGHWIRSGLNPAEMFRILGNRLLTVHLKDLDAPTKEANDVPWGTGCGDLENALRTLAELGSVPALFGIEYESDWENNLPQIEACGMWFAETAGKLAAESNREDPLFVGWASADITPPRPVALVGQYNTRISQGALDPITLTALVLETRGPEEQTEQAVVISCDLCFVDRSAVDRLRAVLRERVPELDADKVVVSATHTHDGPGLDDATLEGVYDTSGAPDVMSASEYGAFFVDKAAGAVAEAWAGRAPAGMSWALGCAVVGVDRGVAVRLPDRRQRRARPRLTGEHQDLAGDQPALGGGLPGGLLPDQGARADHQSPEPYTAATACCCRRSARRPGGRLG